MGDEAPYMGSQSTPKPVSGRASPLVSAGQILDKFISLSNQPSRENSDIKPTQKLGFNDEYRQALAVYAVEMCFVWKLDVLI